MPLTKHPDDTPIQESETTVASRPSEQSEARAAIIDFIVWNQAMEGISTSRERAEAAYDEALCNRQRTLER